MKDLASPQEIFRMFKGLVTWEEDSGIISFSHFSIKELILSHRLEGTAAEKFQVGMNHAHGVLAKRCLGYLLNQDAHTYEAETSLEKDLIKYPLLDYAAKSWAEHAKNTGLDTDLDTLIIKLLTNGEKDESSDTHFAMWTQLDNYKKHWYSSFRRWHDDVTPMGTAIAIKRWAVIEELIDDGFHFQNSSFRTPLDWAISEGLDDVLELLLANGIDPNETTSSSGTTALHSALQNNRPSSLGILLDRGGDPHLVCEEIEGSPFSQAAEHSSLEMVEFLVNRLQPGTIDSYGGYCGTALQRAASAGRKDVIAILIKHNADINLNLSEYGSALHQAATSGHLSIVRYLIDQGADPNTLGERGSPLQAAICYRKIPVAKFLLNCSRTDVDLDTGIHGNALQQALVSNQVGVSWDLIKRGARGFNESSYCKTALEAAIRHSNKGLLQTLIDQTPAHLTSGPYPSRILQRAIVEDKVHALAYLIQCGRKRVRLTNMDGRLGYALSIAIIPKRYASSMTTGFRFRRWE